MRSDSTLKKVSGILISLFITLAYPQFGCVLANHYQDGFGIGWLYLHHTGQMLLAFITILLVTLFSGKKVIDWGLSLNNWRWSLKTASFFAAGWLLLTLLFHLVFDFNSQVTYELTASNIFYDLFFDFILTGLSEELLFRGLIMGILIYTWQGDIRIGKSSISIAGVITTLLFSVAHLGINWGDFTITLLSPLQLVFTIGLGLFYAIMRDKTNSLLGPIIAHGASDGLITVVQLLLISL